ncbi:MAG: TIGR01777 family oxidoreductase [Actinomycetes bacterium]
MDIAVTGASGLIGTALTRSLTAQGHRVLRLVRKDGGGNDTVRWDPAAGTIDAAGLEGLDAVVHLAGEGIGEKRWSAEQKERIRSSRTLGTALVARTLAGLKSPPKVLLSGSAIGFYGDTGDRVVDETAPAGKDFLASVCVEWEAAAAPAVDAGIRTAFLRTGIVLSADGGALGKVLPIYKLGGGGRSGSGRQWWSWISLDDQVAATEFLLTADVAGPVNMVAPHPVTNAEYAKALGRAVHRPTTITPMFGPRLLLGKELADSLLLTSTRVAPAVLEQAGYQFAQPDLDGALRSLLAA